MAESQQEAVALSQQQKRYSTSSGGLSTYRSLIGCDESLADFLLYEIITLSFSNIPGLIGFGARSLTYPLLMKSCGRRPAFGRGIVLRGGKKVSIGQSLLADDYLTLDARDGGEIALGDRVSLGRFSTLAAKGGTISLADGVNIGTHCRVATQSSLSIGQSTLVAAYAYIGPGNHMPDDDGNFLSGEMDIKGGVSIGANVWIGTRATIVDGVTVGDGAVVAAHSFVNKDVPAGAVVAGCPAKIVSTGDSKES